MIRTARKWRSGDVVALGLLFVARRHVDYVRVSSALCRPMS
ncbi:MAG: putative leader peptide [Pseudonocardiaceae bacterium]